MALAFTVVGFSFVFENEDFFAFALLYNFSSNFCAFNYRLADFNISIVNYGKNFVKYYFAAASAFSFSTFNTSPSATRYCLPPVLITAYIYLHLPCYILAKYGTPSGVYGTSLRGWGQTQSVYTGIIYHTGRYLSTPVLSKSEKVSSCKRGSAVTASVQFSSFSHWRIILWFSHSASHGLTIIKMLRGAHGLARSVRSDVLFQALPFPATAPCRCPGIPARA